MIKWKLAAQHWQARRKDGQIEGAGAIHQLMIASMPARTKQMYEAIRDHPQQSAGELGRVLGISGNNALGLCYKLQKLGLVKAKWGDTHAYYRWEIRS